MKLKQKLKTVFISDGGAISYWGPPENKKIIFIAGRDNALKDQFLIHSFIDFFQKQNLTVAWYESRGSMFCKLTTPAKNYPPFIKKIIRSLMLLKHPRYWSCIFWWHRKKIQELPFLVQSLKEALTTLGPHKEIIIISRSAGGRYASSIANEMGISKLICIGYPFKHPEKNEEPERFRHLPELKMPCLIIQGVNDEYGGAEIKEKYQLAPTTELFFVNSGHDFDALNEVWEKVLEKIKDFI